MLTIEVKMNDVVIGTATAVHKDDRNGFRDYDCTLEYRGTDGHLYHAEWEMWGHNRGDGALTLAERVLKEGRHRAKRKVIDE